MACVLAMLLWIPAMAGVFETEDRDEWFAAAGQVTTIGFNEYPKFTFITGQYADLGVLFVDGDDNIICCNEDVYLQDGSGLDGNSSITLEFAAPMTAIAADFPGGLQMELYADGELIVRSGPFGSPGVGNFGGVVTTTPFDSVVLVDWLSSQVFLDDLHFGASIARPADVNGDGEVGVLDLVAVIVGWGPCPEDGQCLADVNGDSLVDVADLLEVLLNWT